MRIDEKRYSVRTYRIVELSQAGVSYVFMQFEGQATAHLEGLKDGVKLRLGAQFDPKRDSILLYGMAPDRMSIAEWQEHLNVARRLFNEWGGLAKFRTLTFKQHIFSREDGREVTLTEALG